MFQSSLFLVNRDFRNLATEFYYRRNQFEASIGNGDVNPEQFSCLINKLSMVSTWNNRLLHFLDHQFRLVRRDEHGHTNGRIGKIN